jgi:CRP-like cAMP-binding protein
VHYHLLTGARLLTPIEKLLVATGASEARLSAEQLARLVAAFQINSVRSHDLLATQGQPSAWEIALISGRAASLARDAEGRETCLGLYIAPCILPPNIARNRDGLALADIEMMGDGTIARVGEDTLVSLMLEDTEIREWANAIMRAELNRKVRREWALAVLPASERLEWFRGDFPGFEDLFPHRHIASFLGITPVTLSRVRSKIGERHDG